VPAPKAPNTAQARCLLVLALAAGCAEPTQVRIVERVDPDGTFYTRDVELPTLASITEVRGDVLELRGGSTLHIAAAAPVDGGAGRARLIQDDATPSVSWIDAGGVAVATDYDGLAMLSAYAHFERAALFFQSAGVASAAAAVPVYYHPKIPSAEEYGLPRTDNAAFFHNADAFLILPMSFLEDIPFAMNPGVLAHEYSHRVFYYTAWDGRMFQLLTRALTVDANATAEWNLIRAADEGVADFFGALLADDPRFLSHSVFPELADPRDLSVLRGVAAAWAGGVQPQTSGVYDPYALGAVLASTLWAFKDIAGANATAAAVIAAERALASALTSSVATSGSLGYALGALEAEVIAALPGSERGALCDRAALAYAAVWANFAAVCP
jgi:hypothetical protein